MAYRQRHHNTRAKPDQVDAHRLRNRLLATLQPVQATLVAITTKSTTSTLRRACAPKLDYESNVDNSAVGLQVRDGLPIYTGIGLLPTCGECTQLPSEVRGRGRCRHHGFLAVRDQRC